MSVKVCVEVRVHLPCRPMQLDRIGLHESCIVLYRLISCIWFTVIQRESAINPMTAVMHCVRMTTDPGMVLRAEADRTRDGGAHIKQMPHTSDAGGYIKTSPQALNHSTLPHALRSRE